MPDAVAIVPTDQPSVFDVLDTLTTLQRRAIVRPENPPPGVAGFIFDIPEETEIMLRSLITRHFVEDGLAVSDQIALEPEEVSVRGLVAEVVAFAPPPDSVARQPDALPPNPATAPALAPQAAQDFAAESLARLQTERVAVNTGNLWNFYLTRGQQPPSQSKQARAAVYFYELWRGRQRVTVETPFGFFTNMALLSFRASQPEDTRFRSTMAITFEKIRVAGAAQVTAGQLAGRAAQQSAPVTQNGVAGKQPVSAADRQSLLLRLAGTLGP